MATRNICWFEIYVGDMDRARAFYEGVLQTRLEKMDSGDLEMWAFGANGDEAGATGALVRMPGVPLGFAGTLVYFDCQDCAVEESRVAQFGGRIHRPKMSIGQHGFISLVVDSEGNMIGLYSRR